MSGLLGHIGLLMAEASAPALTATWDPAVLSPAGVLSSGNLHLAANTGASGAYASTRSTRSLQGLFYISFLVSTNASGAIAGAGIADSTLDLTNGANWAGMGLTSIGVWGVNGTVYVNGVSIGNIGAFVNSSQIEIAGRIGSRRIWVRKAGAAWVGGGDPAADTSPTATLTGSGALYAVSSLTKAGASSLRFCEINGDAASTTGTPPAGFTKANWAP